MKRKLEEDIEKEFSDPETQEIYKELANNGLWISEKHFIEKYFTNETAKILDLGCGTGRTSIVLDNMNFDIIGVDLVPAMIQSAIEVAEEKGLNIDYRIGDATNLDFDDNSFDYALFSNQGSMQIPGKENRLQAMKEVYRVLKKGGIYMFTAHIRTMKGDHKKTWLKSWFRVNILKKLGFQVIERDYGDMFFDREGKKGSKNSKQYIHIPSITEVKKEIVKAGFQILEINGEYQISDKDVREYPPVFYICQK